MSSPRSNSPPRADWLAARALLASRRLRPFVSIGLLLFVLILASSLAVRGLLADRAEVQRATGRTLDSDTLLLAGEVRAARLRVEAQDSAFRSLLYRAEARASAPALSRESQRVRDSLRTLVMQLDVALGRATRAPLATSYRALAGAEAIRALGGVQELLDTLDALDRSRLMLGPVEAPQREFAQLAQRANAVGSMLQAIGQARRTALVRQISALEGGALTRAQSEAYLADSTAVGRARDRARTVAEAAEAQLRATRQRVATESARADSVARARSARVLGVSPVVVAMSALLMASVLIFTLAVTAEVRRPTIAHAREVERITGVPVLGTAYPGHLPGEGRARLRFGTGIDPFRMVYLALTASGTRERTVCITGDDPELVAAVAGRLAVSAASDERATLVVDIAPGTPAVTRYFGERHEPGFSEAVAAIRLWREVARPVGASEGLGLDIIPAGARRTDTVESLAMASNRHEFRLFASEYDFTILASPTRESTSFAMALCEKPATIYVARVARTPLETFGKELNSLRSMALELHGVLLVDIS